MKSLKIFGTLAVAGLLTFSLNAYAQEDGNRDENGKIVRGSYESNKFWDNWFINLGAGVITTFGPDLDFKVGGVAVQANVGKWITPTVGLRIGYSGVKNAFDVKNSVAHNTYGQPYLLEDNEWDQHFVHVDLMWNAFNSIWGYKETRVWNLIPYGQAGYLRAGQTDQNEWGLGAGLINSFRLGKHVSLFLDLNLIVARSAMYGIPGYENRFARLASLTGGLTFNLGKTGFVRHTSVTPAVVPLPFTLDQYNALQDRVNALEAENAALKNEIAALKNRAPEVVYRDVMIASPATLYFDSNSAKLSVREKAHLDFYIENVLAKTSNEITVYGHADKNTGNDWINTRIAGKRAEVVKNYIVGKGIDANRVKVVNESDKNNQFGNPFQLNRCVIIK
jgi:outer membrane protein OmpA-like peptidoglycan-associated protein